MFNQGNMASVEGSGIKEINECPFKARNAPIVSVCLKSDQTCVGEEKCPDWQAYVNTNRILEILRSVHSDA